MLFRNIIILWQFKENWSRRERTATDLYNILLKERLVYVRLCTLRFRYQRPTNLSIRFEGLQGAERQLSWSCYIGIFEITIQAFLSV